MLIEHLLLQNLAGLEEGRQYVKVKRFRHLGLIQIPDINGVFGLLGYVFPLSAKLILILVARDCTLPELFTIAAQAEEQYFFGFDGIVINILEQPALLHPCFTRVRRESCTPLFHASFVSLLCFFLYEASL
ncbi:MAG: hypothetical protein COU09_02300 [Candidatus Harrisonbacteria bacterium CG10_big_fil_rev_8_21_14_0_10_44_23]|uniref:Uncharacterized protein n=1 Tax=Candidatus Harrisonbacteria bacterium CG10_big_fil_rev_8_21_14_0_10_44_23 TaxID=1974585 RepID=A0A2H0UQ21_9BACT|nr:MAG: hypothetical protein COU09_02300 [Candidatus Harrisonbacteria bacterium CG10_big_fil_rev_8_21_14_0_10_44_23]